MTTEQRIEVLNIDTVTGGTTTITRVPLPAGSVPAWGAITGTLSSQTDLQTALNGKQASGTYATGTGTASGTNTGDQTNISGSAATVTTNANLTGDVTSSGNATTIGAGKVTQAMLANSGAATTSATTGTMTVNMTSSVVTITPTGACTFNASGGAAGKRLCFIITTSGTASFVLTFSTNFKAAGTLATGTTTAKVFQVSFVCKDGTLWVEEGRTAAM